MSTKSYRVLHYLGLKGMTGVEMFALILSSAQRDLGHNAQLMFHRKERENLDELAALRNIPVHHFVHSGPIKPEASNHKMGRWTLAFKRVLQIKQLLSSGAFDIIHIHPVGVHCLPAFLGAIWARGVKIVVTHHSTLKAFSAYKTKKSDFIFWLEKHFAHKICVSYGEAAQEMVDHGVKPSLVTTIPFCVDMKKFRLVEKKRSSDGPLHAIMTARLVEGKGHSEVIQSMSQLVHEGAAIKLTIVGIGPLLESIKSNINSLNLENNIKIIEHVAHHEMHELLSTMDAILLPSYMVGETFPLSLLEGAAMGLAAIGTYWYGIPDIIVDGETGLLVQPKDLKGLTKALRFLIDHRAECNRMGANAHKRAHSLYSAASVAQQYIKVYQ